MNRRVLVALNDDRAESVRTAGAEQFGEIIFLFEHSTRPRPLDLQDILTASMKRLQELEYAPANDTIVLSGRLNYVLGVVLAAMVLHEEVSLLVFDAFHSRYIHRKVSRA